MPDSDTLIPTSEAAELMGESVRQFIRRVERKTISPALKLPGLRGAYMFNRADVLALKAAPASPQLGVEPVPVIGPRPVAGTFRRLRTPPRSPGDRGGAHGHRVQQ